MEIWSRETGHPKGAVISPETLWELSKRWWDDRLNLDWQRKSIEERQRILNEVGLTSDFWRLSAPSA